MNHLKSGIIIITFALIVFASNLFLAHPALALPAATATAIKVATPMSVPTMTSTPQPTATRTSTQAATSQPTATRTSTHAATAQPSATPTLVPTVVSTPEEMITNLPTSTPEPEPTYPVETSTPELTPNRARPPTATPAVVPTHIVIAWPRFYPPGSAPTRSRAMATPTQNLVANAPARTATRGAPSTSAPGEALPVPGAPIAPGQAITRIARAPGNNPSPAPEIEMNAPDENQPDDALDAEIESAPSDQSVSGAMRVARIASFLGSAMLVVGAGVLALFAIYFFARARLFKRRDE